MINRETLSVFLHFGYLFDTDGVYDYAKWFDQEYQIQISNSSYTELIEMGVSAWRLAFESIPTGQHAIPLNGGLDSRAILGGLLQHYDASAIHTITFGLPGTFDYEIGNQVARRIGTKHHMIDLSKISITNAILEDHVRTQIHLLPIFEKYYFNSIFNTLNLEDFNIWLGFMGEALAGAHLPELTNNKKHDWNHAKQYFAKANHCPEIVLTSPDFDPLKYLPSKPLFKSNLVSYFDQLDFAIRQNSYVRQITMSPGQNFVTPFLKASWVQFILSVPLPLRYQETLYKNILLKMFPKLFALRTKTNKGLPLNANILSRKMRDSNNLLRKLFRKVGAVRLGIDPNLNYVDMARKLRQEKRFQNSCEDILMSLRDRQIVPWLNIDEIWRDHLLMRKNLSRSIELLLTLELYMSNEWFIE